jgi:hypothetical protein
VIEPSAELVARLTEILHVGLGLGYRFGLDVELPAIPGERTPTPDSVLNGVFLEATLTYRLR